MTSALDTENLLSNEVEPLFPSETIAGWGQEQEGTIPSAPLANLGEVPNAPNPLSPAIHLSAPVRVTTGSPTDVIETLNPSPGN